MANNSAIPQFDFRDGELHVKSTLQEVRIRWHPKPLAEEKDRRGRWKECWPEFRLLTPNSDLRRGVADGSPDDAKRQEFLKFRFTMPQALARIVEPFASHQWSLLKLINEAPSGRDLAISNPVLAYALANSSEFRRTMPKAAAIQSIFHSHHKQRIILEWMGFPGTEAMVRLMKKIVPQAVSPSRLRRLCSAVTADQKAAKLLAYHRKINAGMLELVLGRNLADLVTPRLLADIAQADSELSVPHTADQLFQALEILGEIGSRRRIPRLTSIRRAREFCDDVDAEYRAHRQRQREIIAAMQARAEEQRRTRKTRGKKDRTFPVPPVPGTETIVPITCKAELVKEGDEQGNCVASYERRIIEGNAYIYKVLAPDRSTLSIVKGAGGCWRRSELKKKRNRKVSKKTILAVDHWLSRYSLSI